MEIVDTMTRKNVNFKCLKETNWMGEKEKELHGPRFKHWYTNKARSISRVGIVFDNGWKGYCRCKMDMRSEHRPKICGGTIHL